MITFFFFFRVVIRLMISVTPRFVIFHVFRLSFNYVSELRSIFFYSYHTTLSLSRSRARLAIETTGKHKDFPTKKQTGRKKYFFRRQNTGRGRKTIGCFDIVMI